MTRASDLRRRFLELHTDPPGEPTPGILVMPNPWDVGSARLLEASGCRALATTSAGFAGSIGRHDQDISRDDLIDHVDLISGAVDVPLNVDAEDCFGRDAAGVVETVRLLAATDAAGFSIEDYDPRTDTVRDVGDATERVAAACSVDGDLVVTARCENLLHGIADLDDTIARLIAYRDAGAHVVYAPGLGDLGAIAQVVEAVEVPVNVLALPNAPTVPELASVGVARVSLGSLLAWAAYGALIDAAEELLGPGTSSYASQLLSTRLRNAAFDEPRHDADAREEGR
ncbi:MAG: isocitrate lyase/phosphoenolpyruvate mutase family protein [Acidimicrobiia bacterium]|nr:isocitrate lyase/phosphoenolpyruvate mutase family protein [Acidimicrobiia bacterium]